ncbi:MAG: hypothetical protein KAT68_14960 [Bacteroidales bacterium]|nr:hypothetical protein [Bacteroidales bacterium]
MRYSILIFLLLITFSAFSQNYWHAAGVRGGLSSGITYKKFLDDENAFEGMISFKRGIKFTLLKEVHEPKFNEFVENLYVFHGFGGHLGFLNKDYNSETIKIINTELNKSYTTPVIGLDAIMGIEYRFESVPFVIGIEYKPYFDLFGKSIFDIHLGDFAFALKYTY